MKSLIQEIYENTWELAEIPQSEEYLNIKKEASKLFEALEATLGDTQKKLLDDLYCTMAELETEASKTHFVYGFNYGIRLISEAKQS
ncbi:MAG: hypothetical protein NC131_14140 [Roseburia sp.]|nr:hypothetical protein [Roseburia sp.]